MLKNKHQHHNYKYKEEIKISLQLATSQYGVEFSTPQPRILIAEKKTFNLKKKIP
jgi:hypothetical protein